ncbi:MAG: DUF2178 domain-containing protein [Candidatus Methanoperedens sp.]|jgi:uncharacterized membrane protein|nr:DUF2178 domain-containing protein [Candidatus Methanoperedens sp.]PKL53064.1 MAG: hypothetical protein CVV36_09125 [Candidatus Methanoperedenaceae archaeon HGW-Methanoperedenaceae-1]
MKIRKDKDILKLLVFSLGAILVGISVLLFIKPITIIGLVLITSGILGLIISLRLASKPKDCFLQDERSVRIKEKAGYYAYGIIQSLAAIILVLNIVKPFPSLTPSSDFLSGALFIWVIGLYSFLILKWYYNKKGEV